MIDQALVFIRDEINRHLQQEGGKRPDTSETVGDVVFIEDLDPIAFPIGSISVLLVNIEHERLMRPADPFRRTAPDGTSQRINPDVRIDLSVLFVARFAKYADTLRLLSAVVQFFLEHPAFVRGEHPGLPDTIEKLLIEPITLTFAAQNEVWNALRATYQPSLLYRIRTLVFQDRQPAEVPVYDKTTLRLSNDDTARRGQDAAA